MENKEPINHTVERVFNSSFIKLSDITGGLDISSVNLKIEPELVQELQGIMEFLTLYKDFVNIENSLVTLLFAYRNNLEIIEDLIKKINGFKDEINQLMDDVIELLNNHKELEKWNKIETEYQAVYKCNIWQGLVIIDPIFASEKLKKVVEKRKSKYENLKKYFDGFLYFQYSNNISFQAKINTKLKALRVHQHELIIIIKSFCEEAQKLMPPDNYSIIAGDLKKSKEHKLKLFWQLELNRKNKSMKKTIREYLDNNPESNMTETSLSMAYCRYKNSESGVIFDILKLLFYKTKNPNSDIVKIAIFKHLCCNYYKKQPLGGFIHTTEKLYNMEVKYQFKKLIKKQEGKNIKNEIKYLEREWRQNKNLKALKLLANMHISTNDKDDPNKFIKAAILAGLKQFSKYTANEYFIGLLNVKFDILRKRVQIFEPIEKRNMQVSQIEFWCSTSVNNNEVRKMMKAEVIGYKSVKIMKYRSVNNNITSNDTNIVNVRAKVKHTKFYEQLLSIYKIFLKQNYNNNFGCIKVYILNINTPIETLFDLFAK